MAPDLNPDAVDEAAEDPPVTWLAVAVLGVSLALVGLVATVLFLTGLDAGIVAAVPPLALVFDMSVPILIAGVGLFVVAMTEWDPDLEG